MKIRRLNENLSTNTMVIKVADRIYADGFEVVVTNTDNETLYKERYDYGYNASYDERWADSDKPYVTDILDELCSTYSIQKSDIIVQAGSNTFTGKAVSDDKVSRFKRKYIDSLNEAVEDVRFDIKSIRDDINDFFKEKNLYLDMNVEQDDVLICEVIDGDWKHEHLALKLLVDEFFKNRNDVYITSEWTSDYEGSEGDWYSQTYHWRIADKHETLDEAIPALVIKSGATILPKLKLILKYLPQVIMGLDAVKDLYDNLDDDNEVKKYLETKGMKKLEDVYTTASGIYHAVGDVVSSQSSVVEEAFDADKVQKRIAHTDEFDNGHVIHDDYFNATADEAEELARKKSLEDPEKTFYVKYDDVMNPSSDIKWKNGEKLNEEADHQYIIVGITDQGTRVFYNSVDDQFETDVESATIYDEQDVARDDWSKISKTGLKRVFIPIYDPETFKSSVNENFDNINDTDYDTDYRFYVYDEQDNVVSDEFEFEEDAIEWAQTNNYPVVKRHNYFIDEYDKLRPDGDPELIWSM